jgi:hypothetical protein
MAHPSRHDSNYQNIFSHHPNDRPGILMGALCRVRGVPPGARLQGRLGEPHEVLHRAHDRLVPADNLLFSAGKCRIVVNIDGSSRYDDSSTRFLPPFYPPDSFPNFYFIAADIYKRIYSLCAVERRVNIEVLGVKSTEIGKYS